MSLPDPPFVREIDAKAAGGDDACQAAARCLQAMRSVIGQNKMVPSPTAYFAATVAALQKLEQQGETEATASALLLLLRRAMAAAPPGVVRARAADVSVALSAVLRNAGNEGLVRQALGCLSTAADSAYDADSRPNKKVLKPAFQFLADSRQAVRHQAELTVALILRRAGSCGDQMTMDFASQHLVQMLSDTTHDKRSSDEMPAQRGATLLKALGPSLPEANLCDVFAALLKLPGKLGQHPCCIEGFGFMASYFRKEGEHGALAANLLPGLLGVPMAFLNVAYVVAYADALAACVAALTPAGVRAGLSPQLQKQKIAAVKRILSIFAERDPSLLRGAHEAGAAVMEAVGAHADEPMLQALPELCLGLLGYEAKGAFNRCFPVIGALFGAFGACRDRLSPGEVPAFSAAAFQQAKPLIEGLVAIRDKSHGGDINMFGEKLHECLGAAVSAFGPEHVLSVADLHLLEVPLSDQAFTEKSRSWMLLVLRDCCRRANLALFSQKFLPLASALKSRVSAAAAISPIEGKRYETMLEHVWGVLPGFCSEPLDMPAAMLGEGGKLAKQLVSVLQGEPALRDHVWAAFTRLTDGRTPMNILGASKKKQADPEVSNVDLMRLRDSDPATRCQRPAVGPRQGALRLEPPVPPDPLRPRPARDVQRVPEGDARCIARHGTVMNVRVPAQRSHPYVYVSNGRGFA